MLGAGIALLTSLAWSISSICVKLVADKINSLVINTLRTCVGSALLISLVMVTGRYQAFSDISWGSLAYVVISGVLAMAVGDTIYIKSVALLDVSIAFPLSQCCFHPFGGPVSYFIFRRTVHLDHHHRGRFGDSGHLLNDLIQGAGGAPQRIKNGLIPRACFSS